MILLQFGAAPIACSVLDIGDIEGSSLKAFLYVFLGTVCFCVGSLCVEKAKAGSFYLCKRNPTRMSKRALLLLGIGSAAKIYMMHAGLFMYGSLVGNVESAASYREYLALLASLAICAQIVISIEYFCESDKVFVVYVFWLTTMGNIFFSVLSGMKSELLLVPAIVLLVRKLVTGKFGRHFAVSFALLCLLIFPANNAYRSEIQVQGGVTSVTDGRSALGRAFSSLDFDRNYFSASVDSCLIRLNLLPSVDFLQQDVNAGSIAGDERVWMIPFYSFVPRFLWTDKPVLDKGRRLSVAMGAPETTSTAVTPFGDLISMGGITALSLGMFFLGIGIQSIGNMVKGRFGAKVLFIYCVLFSRFYLPEYDLVMLGTSVIQTFCFSLLIAYLVYGGENRWRTSKFSPLDYRSAVSE
jgi:hypothetical protein